MSFIRFIPWAPTIYTNACANRPFSDFTIAATGCNIPPQVRPWPFAVRPSSLYEAISCEANTRPRGSGTGLKGERMRTAPDRAIHPSSFRDPSGFVYTEGGELYRQVNLAYADDYEQLIESGLLDALVADGLLIPHEDVTPEGGLPQPAYRLLKPQRVPFISYPYEWSFGQLRDAALATLAVQKTAIEHDMSLKDASAYNVQFVDGKPTFIDTLSFEIYYEGEPWVAYRQFCQHFLVPLALMSFVDVRLGQLLRVHLDGIPIDLGSTLLPRRTWARLGTLLHVHLHARAQRSATANDMASTRARYGMSQQAFLGLVDSLKSIVASMKWKPEGTAWADYATMVNEHYTDEASSHKARLVAEYLDAADPKVVWDLGANTGHYSRIASDRGITTMSMDSDPAAVEMNYREVARRQERDLLPLLVDLTNPSPGLGWEHRERDELLRRGPADAVMALALIHHLAISNNVPLGKLAAFMARAGEWLIIEFVPKDDPRVRTLLAGRRDIFDGYTREGFEAAFGQHYTIVRRDDIQDSPRTMYLMRKNGTA